MKRDLPLSQAKEDQIAATREIVRLIKSLPVYAKTPAAYGHIADILVQQITHSGWGHLDDAVSSVEFLADAATVLGGMEEDVVGLDFDPAELVRQGGEWSCGEGDR